MKKVNKGLIVSLFEWIGFQWSKVRWRTNGEDDGKDDGEDDGEDDDGDRFDDSQIWLLYI